MARKNRTIPDKRIWTAYLIIGVLLMAGVAFFSSWRAMRTAEERFCQTLEFVKSQSTSFEKHNDTITAKALRRTAVAVHQLAENPALDLSDPQCLNRQTEKLWLTGISVLGPDGTLRCESTTNGIGYDRFGDQLKNDAVLDVLSYPRKTYVKRVLLEDGSAVDVAAHRAESTELLLLAYRYTPAEFVEETALSIQSILDGYPAETSGTLFIVQNNQVVAANRPELIGQDVAGSPLAQGIRKAGAAEKLTHTRDWNGSGCYFGMFCHGRSFDLYAYTDEKIIFRESLLLILTVLVGYILLVMILQLLRRRSVQEMELQKKEQERKYQTQLEEQNRKLEIALQHEGAANRAKREFLFNMSHDIRTPMNAIIGITTLMKNELHQPEKLAEHLDKLENSGQLLLGIINDILDMSRIESGKTTLNVEKMNLPQQISQLDSIIRQQAGQRRQTFTVNTHLQHENVLADPNRLNRVLMNILSNAVKYTPTGGHIRFEVDELPRNEHYARYRFVVQDDGIGMSEAYQKTLFDPFTREERSGTNKVQGTGLGMAITKNIVDLMGGSINVESTTGKGTRFEVVLEFPVDAEADTVPEAQVLPEEEEKTSPLSGMKFLCAEDNAINAEILEMLLEANGASCTICSNGQEIVDAFASVKPGEYDMILMDVQMPVMDGLEATRRIRSGENPLGRIIPILAMTANAFLEDMQKSREAGMDEHLSKPVDIAALEQTVKRFRVIPPKINSGQARFRRGSTQAM